MNRLRALWSSLQASFWLVPTAISVLSAAAGIALVEFDNWDRGQLADWSPRLFGAGPDGSRAMLSAIASATITVAGVVFSITTLTLAQTATQYSPSVLRNFMRDRPTQVSLGIFLGVFVYCIVVLRTVRGGDGFTYVPSVAVLGGIAYALAGIGTLIYFIHHVAQSIQVSSILARIMRDTERAIRRWPASAPRPQDLPSSALPSTWTPVESLSSGYIALVDTAGLSELARGVSRVVRVEAQMGGFIPEGAAVVSLGGPAEIPEEVARRARDAVLLGEQRTTEQDPGFGLQQLVDIALRALSSGVNDPSTAIMCIDQLGALLGLLAQRAQPPSQHVEDGRLLLITPVASVADGIDQVFHPLVRDGGGQRAVAMALLRALAHVARQAWGHDERAALQRALDELQNEVAGSTASCTAVMAHLANVREIAARVPAQPRESRSRESALE